jgi:hypothetical protein
MQHNATKTVYVTVSYVLAIFWMFSLSHCACLFVCTHRYVQGDELIEVTPAAVRLRKQVRVKH